MKMDLFCILETLAEGLIRIEIIRCPTDRNRELIPRPMPIAVSSRLSVMDLTPLWPTFSDNLVKYAARERINVFNYLFLLYIYYRVYKVRWSLVYSWLHGKAGAKRKQIHNPINLQNTAKYSANYCTFKSDIIFTCYEFNLWKLVKYVLKKKRNFYCIYEDRNTQLYIFTLYNQKYLM